jgi:hypothetical protein
MAEWCRGGKDRQYYWRTRAVMTVWQAAVRARVGYTGHARLWRVKSFGALDTHRKRPEVLVCRDVVARPPRLDDRGNVIGLSVSTRSLRLGSWFPPSHSALISLQAIRTSQDGRRRRTEAIHAADAAKLGRYVTHARPNSSPLRSHVPAIRRTGILLGMNTHIVIEHSVPPTLLATLITAQHARPFQPMPMLFPPLLLFSSYLNLSGYQSDAAGITAAWSGLYALLAIRRSQVSDCSYSWDRTLLSFMLSGHQEQVHDTGHSQRRLTYTLCSQCRWVWTCVYVRQTGTGREEGLNSTVCHLRLYHSFTKLYNSNISST